MVGERHGVDSRGNGGKRDDSCILRWKSSRAVAGGALSAERRGSVASREECVTGRAWEVMMVEWRQEKGEENEEEG